MMIDRRLLAGVVVAGLGLLAAACGGDSSDLLDQSTQGEQSASIPPPQSESDQRSVDGEADLDPQAVRPVVEIPDGWDSPIEAVYNRYWLYWEAFAAAFGPPHADPTYQPLQELSTEENWQSLELQLHEFADDGVMLTLPRQSASEHLIRIPNASVLAEDEGTEVILQDCWIDDFIQQTVDGQVLEKGKEAKLMNVVMRMADGQWRVAGVNRATAESDGYEQCEELG